MSREEWVERARVARARNGDPSTSHEAARRVTPKIGTWRAKVEAALKANPEGLTDFELERMLGGRPQTVRTRRSELVDDGVVCDTGERRPTDSGSSAIVWAISN